MIDGGAIATGVAVGVASQHAQGAVNKTLEKTGLKHPSAGADDIVDRLDRHTVLLHDLLDALSSAEKPDRYQNITLSIGNPLYIKRNDYTKLYLILPTACVVSMTFPGVPAIAFSLTSGLYPLPIPQDGQLSLDSTSPIASVNAGLLYSENSYDGMHN